MRSNPSILGCPSVSLTQVIFWKFPECLGFEAGDLRSFSVLQPCGSHTLSCLIALGANWRASLGQEAPGAMGVVLRFACPRAMPKALGQAVYSWSARLPESASCLGSGGGRRRWGGKLGCSSQSWGWYCHAEIGLLRAGCSASFNKLLLDIFLLLGLL